MGSKRKHNLRTFFSRRWFNKYVLAALLFIAWITFFDKYNLVNQFKLSRAVKKLEKEKLEYAKKLEKATEEKIILENDKERYAREKYYMHKENEDVVKIERDGQ